MHVAQKTLRVELTRQMIQLVVVAVRLLQVLIKLPIPAFAVITLGTKRVIHSDFVVKQILTRTLMRGLVQILFLIIQQLQILLVVEERCM